MGSDKIYKVFVSSTFEDLREERAAVERGLLQLGCFPVGMELFPAADEETWDFIKSQINDSDYYVIVVAGRYGSQGPDGISFTEMEYDYAIAQKKPTIGFVHADPGSIWASKTETSQEARAKLHNFIEKIKKRPVRLFKNPHELALEVTTSFVQLIRNRPAVGYVRADESVDFKRYSELLEENIRLKEALSATQELPPFPAQKPIRLTFLRVDKEKIGSYPCKTVDCSLIQAFQAVGEGTLLDEEEDRVLKHAAKLLLGDAEKDSNIYFDAASVRILRRELLLYGLLEVDREDRSYRGWSGKVESTHTVTVTIWRLTDYGRRQLAAMAP
jgi:nucleoside 2-deoxyribosyltransferase